MLLLNLLVVVLSANIANGQLTEAEMIQRLRTYDDQTKSYCNQQATANWNVQTDVGNTEKEDAQVSDCVGCGRLLCSD